MANKKAEQPAAAEASKENKYRDGRWTTPSRRAKGYAADRKARVSDRSGGERDGACIFLQAPFPNSNSRR